MADLLAVTLAAVVVLGGWACLAALVAYFAHRRMRRAEADLGAPALPSDETPLLLMATAWIAYPASLVVALVGLVNPKWTRVGRNATFVFLAQISAAVLAALGAVIWGSLGPPGSESDQLLSIVVASCAIAGIGILVSLCHFWLWAGRRAARLRARPAEGPAPGWWRLAIYLVSLVFWPAGVVSAVVFSKPENAGVGATALRCSLVQFAIIAVAVCVGLPFLMRALPWP